MAITVAVLATVAVVLGAVRAAPVGTVGGTPVAAERIDLSLPSVPVLSVSAFGPPTGDPQAGNPQQSAASLLTSSADGDRTVAAVLTDLQDFWSAQLSADGGPRFRAPLGGYVSMDSSAPTGSALCVTDPSQVIGNAFYCPQGDGIVFDSSALVPVLLGSYGTAGLAAAFAHEFGHAVQAQAGPTQQDRLRDPDRYPSIVIEAQADCAAGAFLAAASSGAARRVHVPPSSLVRAVAPLLDFRDPATVSPTDPTAHGLGLDRLGFVLTGFRDGAAACRAMSSDTLELTLGRAGVTTSPPSTLPRFDSAATVQMAAQGSVAGFVDGLDGQPALRAAQTQPEPDDLSRAGSIGQFAAAAAVALAAGRSITGSETGAACFTGAWTASVFGESGVDGLGSWPTDADEAMDLIRSRPDAQFDELAAYSDGFHRGFAACR